MGYEDVDWNHLAAYKIQWRYHVKVVMNNQTA